MKIRTQKEQEEETACERNDKIGWIGEYEAACQRSKRNDWSEWSGEYETAWGRNE